MTDNENSDLRQHPLSLSQKLLKKISVRSLHDTSDSDSSMDISTSPELHNPIPKEQSFQNDPRFRKYVQLVDKNLQSFDAVNEWADIISFLGRLLKSFQAYPQFPVIPKKQVVAKRLAQCLNPGFPAGVHQKTLDVYAYILQTIGPDQLTMDLPLWSTGLFPFVQYAATHVKPQLLALFERYYFPLQARLRPAMRGLIIALLPALEEEGSEYFDKVVTMIERLSETVELPYFYSCVWLVMISNPTLRPPALNFLLRKLPKIVDREDISLVLGGRESVSLMIRAFSVTCNDQQILVQRGILELLVQNFILKNRAIPHDDLVILMRSVLTIVLRKDMSLNRRLYAWLLGNENTTQAQMLYFSTYAEKAATQAIKSMFHENKNTNNDQDDTLSMADAQRPYKTLISLMDKWEIGQPIVNNVFIDALKSLQGQMERYPDITQTANMWVDMVEPYLICIKLFELVDTCFPGSNNNKNQQRQQSSNLESIKLMEFTLKSLKLTDDEIKHIHLPLILAALSKKLNDSIKNPVFIEILPQVGECISLVTLILDQLPESIFFNRSPPDIPGAEGDEEAEANERKQFKAGMNVLDYVREFYNIGQPQSNTNNVVEEFMESEKNEEQGDLSATSQFKSTPSNMAPMVRPEFDPLRGQVLVKEVTDNITGFLIELVNNYIVLPDDLMSGVDVGVEGKRLKHIESRLQTVLHTACAVLTRLVRYADKTIQLKAGYKEELTQVLLKCCQQGNEFGVVDAGLSTLTSLVKKKRFVLGAILRQSSHVISIMDKLWGFLSPNIQLLHMRTVELIWLLTDASMPREIETIISNYLIAQNDDQRLANYEKFGIIWEFSESIPHASQVFSRPMFLILDLLDDRASPLDRRAGESWIRCHLKSYARLLEPFIVSVLDKKILRRDANLSVKWNHQQCKNKDKQEETNIAYFVYPRPFDTDVVDYMFNTLIRLVTFGGLNILKACKGHMLDDSSSTAKIVNESLDLDITTSPISFLELLVFISIRFLETETTDKLSESMLKPIRSMQMHAADLLYLIISKLDYVNIKLVQKIQTGTLSKLLFCIATHNLDLQQKLLHLLHATLAITAASAQQNKDKPQRRKGSIDMLEYHYEPSKTHQEQQHQYTDAVALMRSSSDLFVKCATDALIERSNHPMLQHWMDFLQASLPYVQNNFRHVIVPLIMCVCNQINILAQEISILMHGSSDDISLDGSPEKDMVVLLTGLEKMVMFSLTERLTDDWYPTDIKLGCAMPIPNIPDSSGLIGLANLVHSDDPPRMNERPRDVLLYHLPAILHILLNVWRVFRRPNLKQRLGDAKVDAILHSFSYAADQTKARLENTFEKLFKYSAADFIEAFTEIFFVENPAALEFELMTINDLTAFEILAITPTCSPQHVLSNLLDSIRQRTPGAYHSRRRKIQRHGKLTDTSLLRFAEIYCIQMNRPESIQLLWPIIHAFAKDYLSQANTYKMFLPSLMRFLTVSLEVLSKSDAFDDRRTRKDAQELYQRCVDYCILIAGRSFDQSLWMRRANNTVYDDDDMSSINTDHTFSESGNVSTGNISDLEKKTSWKSNEDVMITQVNQYLAQEVIPRLRQLLVDNDKINSLLNNLVYYVIGPALKSKTAKNAVILNQLCEMARMPFSYKTWRKEIWEVFIDNRFFYMSPPTAKKWRSIIQTAFSIEKERFPELMTRITTSPSTTFFSNKDIETMNRSLNLRRLSFVLFSGHVDQYITQLPIIQEKVVDLLKLEHGEMVHVEIYLCLRVLLVRFSQKHLMNFWPVLITELMRLFNSFLVSDFQDRPEEAQIALAGCKFLDLLCTLELDAFQIFQWIFIRDTVETLITTVNKGPTPMMEQLDEKLTRSPTYALTNEFLEPAAAPSLGSLKRPMLTMHSISSISQLSFFIENVGLYVYQSSFTLSKPDMPFIESLLQNDLLEGDIDAEN